MPGGYYDPIRKAPLDQLLRWWAGEDRPLAEFGDEFFDEVAAALSNEGQVGFTALKRSLGAADIPRRRAALTFLASPELADGEVRAELQRACASPDLSLKTRALWGLVDLGFYPLERAEVERLMRHEDERIAALAMCYLSQAVPAEAVEILRAALHSDNPRMREYACDQIGDREIAELSAEMCPLVHDVDKDVAQAARSNLECFPQDVV
jgi:hypothetical protein